MFLPLCACHQHARKLHRFLQACEMPECFVLPVLIEDHFQFPSAEFYGDIFKNKNLRDHEYHQAFIETVFLEAGPMEKKWTTKATCNVSQDASLLGLDGKKANFLTLPRSQTLSIMDCFAIPQPLCSFVGDIYYIYTHISYTYSVYIYIYIHIPQISWFGFISPSLPKDSRKTNSRLLESLLHPDRWQDLSWPTRPFSCYNGSVRAHARE